MNAKPINPLQGRQLAVQQQRLMTRRSFLQLATTTCAIGAFGSTFGITLSGCSSSRSTKADEWTKLYKEGSDSVQAYIDSAGREVYLPREIHSVSPSGSYAQLMLCTLCPELLVSVSGGFSTKQAVYFDERVTSLPSLGSFYGSKNGDMSYEGLLREDPDVVIDVGEHKATIVEDLDGLQAQTGIPALFELATIEYMPQAYRKLGALLGVAERGNELADYIDAVLTFAQENRSRIADEDLRVVYSTGEFGYEVKAAGSVHAMALDLLGVENVAKLDEAGGTEVSAEQMMIWAPDVVLLSPVSGFFDDIYDDPAWASIPAIQNKRVYEVPGEPYEWLDRPPSVQVVLGLLWLGNLLFPEIYDYDMLLTTQEFFKLFWNYVLSDSEAQALLARSTLLSEA